MAGLFDTASAAQTEAAIAAQQADSEERSFMRQAAALSNLSGAGFAGLMAGNLFGRAIQRATGNSSEDPRVAKARALDQVKQRVLMSGAPPGSREHTQIAVSELLAIGEFDLAMQARERGFAMEKARLQNENIRSQIAEREAPPGEPEAIRTLRALQANPELAELQRQQKRSGAQTTNINIKTTAEERKRIAGQDVALGDLERLETLVTSGNVGVGAVKGRTLRASGATGVGLSEAEAEALSLEEGLSNSLLQAMRGAQVGPAEQVKFERQLPRVDQPKALFMANLRRTKRNLRDLRKKEAELRGEAPAAQAAPSRVINFSDLPK